MTRYSQYRFLAIAMLLSARVGLGTVPDFGKVAFADEIGKDGLTKRTEFEAIVRTPAGLPAARAKVVVGSDNSTIWLKNGEICEGRSDGVFLQTDNGGRLHFRPRLSEFWIAITHSSGYAIFRPGPSSHRRVITLDPWTRIEGHMCTPVRR